VIVGAEEFSCTEITELSRRGQSTGRVSVDVEVDLPVDRYGIRPGLCPASTPSLTTVGILGSPLPVPHPVDGPLYVKLCDGPSVINPATLTAEFLPTSPDHLARSVCRSATGDRH
jgi:hypothetical protein